MKVYQPTVLNTLLPYAGPQGFGMNRFTGQTIAQQTTAGSNQIDPVPFRGYSVPAPSLAYYGLSEPKRHWTKTVGMIVSPHYAVMRLLVEKSQKEENERFQQTRAKMIYDIRMDWERSGKTGDVFKSTLPESDEFMEKAILGRINFWTPKLTDSNKGAARVAARHVRAAEAIANEWVPRTAPPPPPPLLPPPPGTDTAGTTTTPGTAPQAPGAPGSILPTTGFFSKPLNLALVAAGVFLVAKQFKIV